MISWPTVRLRAGASVDRVHVIPTCVDPRIYPVARQDDGEGVVDSGLDRVGQHTQGPRPVARDLGTSGEGIPATAVARDL